MEIRTWQCDVCGELLIKRHDFGELKLSGIKLGNQGDVIDFKDVCSGCTIKIFEFLGSLTPKE